ncbi:MAG: polymer-forming cytoskeletal protein [Deltaproteobacteria bacterium]|nr:polymer-forming cytoskeletal protein [Deltaproteobacteria bacterium]
MAKPSTETKTEVAAGSVVRGRVTGAEDVIVAGRLEGSLELSGDLTVQKTGVVKANVTAERVIVAGILVGDVMATMAIEITAEGRVKGDLSAPKVKIAEGGRFAGQLQIGDAEGVERRAPSPPRFVDPAPADDEYEEVEELEGDETQAPMPGLVAVRGGDERRKRRIVVKKRS